MKRHRMKKKLKKKRMRRSADYGIGESIGGMVSATKPAVGLGVTMGAASTAFGQLGGIGSATDKLLKK